jgi:hypothetical protein
MRKTAHKQNSFIARYCLAVVVILALLGPLAGESRGSLFLCGDDELTVDWNYEGYATLRGRGHLSIVSGGHVDRIEAYDSSRVDVSDGSVNTIEAHGSSNVNVFSGTVLGLFVDSCDWGSNSRSGSSIANIFGGCVSYVGAYAGVVIFYGQAFHTETAWFCASASEGASWTTCYDEEPRIEGNRLFRAGYLNGQWLDETPWTTCIVANERHATILVSAVGPICSQEIRVMDFNADCKVNLIDFAIMASPGLRYASINSSGEVQRTSYANFDGRRTFRRYGVSYFDWITFSQNWLEQ